MILFQPTIRGVLLTYFALRRYINFIYRKQFAIRHSPGLDEDNPGLDEDLSKVEIKCDKLLVSHKKFQTCIIYSNSEKIYIKVYFSNNDFR